MKSPSPKSQLQSNPQKYTWLLIAIFVTLGVLIDSESKSRNYSIFNRSWGFDHITFFGLPGILILSLLSLLFIVPTSNLFLQKIFVKGIEFVKKLLKKKVFIFLLVTILSVVCFYLLRVKFFFLGDLDLRMQQTMKREFVDTEYFTMKLLYLFTTTGVKYGGTIEQMFRLYSYIAGGLFVFVSCFIADKAGTGPFEKVMIFCFHTFTAMLLVFCGYVEVYATPILFLNLYILAALDYFQSQRKFYFLVLSLALAVASHLLCLVAFPSLLVLMYFKNKEHFKWITKISNRTIFLVVAFFIIAGIATAIKIGHSFLLTWSAPASSPHLLTFLSIPHLWELFNGQLLANGLNFIFIFILLRKAIVQRHKLNGFQYFLMSLSGCLFLFVLVANLQRGSGDWDLMAFPAIALNLLAALLIIQLYQNRVQVRNYLLFSLVFINSTHALLWLQINHSDLSIKKVESMLINDPGNYYVARISGKVQMVLALRTSGQLVEAEKLAKESCEDRVNVDLRACVMYAELLKQQGKIQEATVFYEDLLQHRSPYIYEAYIFLMEHFELDKQPEKVELYLSLMFEAFSREPKLFMNNINFRMPVLIQLFEILEVFEKDKNKTANVIKIRQTIDALKQLQASGKK